ncbi:hypothetical protein QBC40DRAFT_308082 [Triangularia verruculosa]|uniref:F-box domain-containing protein n=1 Tax=Triangularia verruculosa TaxID=2587418 RepID=A0AAN6XE90_9PEZI|nr:hypothetical protein QBC40DRAFT_308082 [Triangularia verruculosa]
MAAMATSDVGPGAPLSSIITTVRDSLTAFTKGKHQAGGKPEEGHPQITDLVITQLKPSTPRQAPNSQASDDKDGHEKPPLHLLALPVELLHSILRHLDFVSILKLRKTCHFLHALASPPQLRILFGRQAMTDLLLQHCKTCFVHHTDGSNLLFCSDEDDGWPLASRCFDCALVAKDERLKIGKKVKLGNEEVVQICRWCGRPIRSDESVAGPGDPHSVGNNRRDGRPFHKGQCYRSYNNSLLFFFLLGWLQLMIAITGAALSWRYWRGAVMVFAPSVTSFLLLWVVMGFLFFRGSRKRAYRYTLLLELAILGCWIPPVYYISMQIVSHPEREVDTAMQAALALFGLNLVFRLFNVIGNMVILCSTPDLTPRKRPNAGWFKRIIYKLMLWSVAWTYPPSVEHRLSPD